MSKNSHVYCCNTEHHKVKVHVKQGRIIKCGYVRRCGSWHYALARPQKYSSKNCVFETCEPKSYKSTLNYCLLVLYTYDKHAFQNLIESAPNCRDLHYFNCVVLPRRLRTLSRHMK